MIAELLERDQIKILCTESVIMTHGDNLYRGNEHNSI